MEMGVLGLAGEAILSKCQAARGIEFPRIGQWRAQIAILTRLMAAPRSMTGQRCFSDGTSCQVVGASFLIRR
jgi:hypothetical protein